MQGSSGVNQRSIILEMSCDHINKHSKKSKFPPSNGDYNFQIICHIINFIILLCGEFNNAHLDTSFASIDPQNIETTPDWRDLPRNLKTALKPIDQRPLTTVCIPLAIS